MRQSPEWNDKLSPWVATNIPGIIHPPRGVSGDGGREINGLRFPIRWEGGHVSHI